MTDAQDETTDQVVVLGSRRGKLLAKQDHLGRQWDAAADSGDTSLAIDLTDEVERDVWVASEQLRAVEQEITETPPTTTAGLLVKLRLLDDICAVLASQLQADAAEDEFHAAAILAEAAADDEPDPLEPRTMRENIALINKLSSSALEDAERLITTPT